MTDADFKPLKCLRRLMDYYLRRKVVEELKEKLETFQVDIRKIYMVELTREVRCNCKAKIFYKTGNNYATRYILPVHPKMRGYMKPCDGKRVNEIIDNWHNHKHFHKLLSNDYEDVAIIEPIADYVYNKITQNIKTISKVKYTNNTEYEHNETWREARENGRLEKWMHCMQFTEYGDQDRKYTFMDKIKAFCSELCKKNSRINGLKYYKIKVVYKTLNFSSSIIHYTSVLNLKHWSKTTKKPSNKGLTAKSAYTYTNYTGHVAGWTFGGITAEDLEMLCITNGMVKVKKQKYQYGDYAEWYISYCM